MAEEKPSCASTGRKPGKHTDFKTKSDRPKSLSSFYMSGRHFSIRRFYKAPSQSAKILGIFLAKIHKVPAAPTVHPKKTGNEA